MARAESDASLVTKAPLCKVCDDIQSVIFCNECRQGMCGSCKKQHDEIEGFEKHSTSPLCTNHAEPLTHICHQCTEGMCIKCMIKDHKSHGKHFTTFDEGVNIMKKKDEEDVTDILERKEEVDARLEKSEKHLQKIKELKQSLKSLRASYIDKISKIDNLLNDVEEEHEKKVEDLVNNLQKASNSCQTLAETLTTKCENDLQYVIDRKVLASERSIICSQTVKLLEIKPGLSFPETDDEELSFMLTDAILDSSTDYFTNPKLVVNYTNNDLKPFDLVLLPDGYAVFAEGKVQKLYSINTEGKKKHLWDLPSQHSGKDVRGLDHYKGFLFVSLRDSDFILCVSLQKFSVEVIKLVDAAFNICVMDKDTLLFSANSKKNISMLRIDHKETNIIKTHTSQCYYSFISFCKVKDRKYTVATLENAGCVELFNEFARVRCIGSEGKGDGNLNEPRGVVLTKTGKILIADRGNNRISCFNLDGTFSQHVLTATDGILSPYATAYRYPFLWVMENSGTHKALKCFQFSAK